MAPAIIDRRPRVTRPEGPRTTRRKRKGRGLRGVWLVAGALGLVLLFAVAAYLLGGRDGSGGAISTLQTNDFHALAFSPADSNVVFFGHHNGVMRSDDGGRTWRALVERRGFDAMGLVVSRADPRRIYLAGHDVFQVSTDGGGAWGPVEHNLPGTDIHGFAMSPDDANRLAAFVVGHGLLGSADGGRTWERLPGRVPDDVMAVVSAGGSPETLYAGSMGAGLLKSADGGQSWAPAINGLGSRGVLALALHPTRRETIYAGTEGGLYRSADGASTWSRLPFPGANAVALAVSPADPNVVLAIAVKNRQGLVFRSDDGGTTWGGRG